MTTPSGGLVGDATIRVRADTDPAMTAITRLARTATRSLATVGSGAGSVALSLGRIGASAGASIPALAAVAAATQSIIPAAAGVATGFLAIQSASAVVQLGMVGVEDAITAAFATGEGSAEEFEEALERLSPAARDFAVAVREMSPALVEFQQSIQEELFTNLDDVLLNTAESVLPTLRSNLLDTAGTLNSMAVGAANAASELADDGTFGQALQGANDGLVSLEGIPAQVVTAFGQLAAAGAPALNALTDAVADAADEISDRLSDAFESGALQDAVLEAIDVLSELGGIAASAFGIVRNVLGAVGAEGEDLFQVIGALLDALEDFTGTQVFQDALGALAETMGVLASSAAPLLISALEVIAPIFTNLAGPVQTLIRSLASGLAPIITALGPVLDAASNSLGILVQSLAPLLPAVGQLIAQLGPVLTPILQSFGTIVQLLAPVVLQFANTLIGSLQPVLSALPAVLQPILDAFTQLLVAVLPLLSALVVAFTPVMDELSVAFIDLLIALEPVITALLLLATDVLVALTPVLIPLISTLVQLSSVFSEMIAGVLNSLVIPALTALSRLLEGDFSGAFNAAGQVVAGFVTTAITGIASLPIRAFSALADLGRRLVSRVTSAFAGMLIATLIGVLRTVLEIEKLPGRALEALGDIGAFLYDAGREFIQGFIDGIRSLAGAVSDAVGSLIDGATGWLPGSPAEMGPLSGQGYVLLRGQRFSRDFAEGIESGEEGVSAATNQLAVAASQAVPMPGVGLALPLSTVPGGAQGVPVTPVQITLTLVNQGVLGSRVEVLDWLTEALDELRRQQRLGVTL